jgi:hypothetical protein
LPYLVTLLTVAIEEQFFGSLLYGSNPMTASCTSAKPALQWSESFFSK